MAADHGLDLTDARPTDLADITARPDLVVSVCDRANETGMPFPVEHRHWSISDPVGGDRCAFEDAFTQIAARIDRLATTAAPG